MIEAWRLQLSGRTKATKRIEFVNYGIIPIMELSPFTLYSKSMSGKPSLKVWRCKVKLKVARGDLLIAKSLSGVGCLTL